MALILDARRLGADRIVATIADALAERPARRGTTAILAVDGGANSGKTTLANRLADAIAGAGVLHTDDLLAGWTDQFRFWPKLHAVLATIAAGVPARVPGYDWIRAEPAGEIVVGPSPVLVVEGVSAIAACGPRATLTVFCDAPRALRERRWVERDGMAMQPQWQRWLDAEDAFFAAHPPSADVIVRHA